MASYTQSTLRQSMERLAKNPTDTIEIAKAVLFLSRLLTVQQNRINDLEEQVKTLRKQP